MKITKNIFRVLGFVLFFGLCITMLSKVDAYAAESEPKLNLSSCSVVRDGTYRLRVYNLNGRSVIYRSSDTSIVTVSNTGKLKGVNYGDAVVTATVVEDGTAVTTLQCDVHIGPAAISIKFTSLELVLKENSTKKIYPIVIPKNTVEKPLYFSSDESIATISSAGFVRAQGIGTAYVYGMLENGKSDSCKVIVLSEEDYEAYKAGKTVDDILSEDADGESEQATTAPVMVMTAPVDVPTAAPTK